MITLIQRPVMTEKMTMLGSKRQYAFRVDLSANKIEIAKAIEKRFNVTVNSVRTIRMKGKMKTQMNRRGRFTGRRPDWKKAIVTLAEGQSIELLSEA